MFLYLKSNFAHFFLNFEIRTKSKQSYRATQTNQNISTGMAPIQMWQQFLEEAKIPSEVVKRYAALLTKNRITFDMLSDLDRAVLSEMKITVVGDQIKILKHAELVASKVLIIFNLILNFSVKLLANLEKAFRNSENIGTIFRVKDFSKLGV